MVRNIQIVKEHAGFLPASGARHHVAAWLSPLTLQHPMEGKLMSYLDRNFQLRILELACETYPGQLGYEPEELLSVDRKKLIQNIAYLSEEEMIKCCLSIPFSGEPDLSIRSITATKDAHNLLTEEGSISAQLKVVTVRLHNESLSMLRTFVESHVSDQEEKNTYLQRIKELPADATRHLLLELLGMGLHRLPDAVQWLQTKLLCR